MASLREVSRNKSFGGYQNVYEHDSMSCNVPMRFGIYLPQQAETQRVPVLYYLSGLTCTEQNFIQKSGVQHYAAEHGIAVVSLDTSPRNCNIPGEKDSWDLGAGASFYVDATEEPWKGFYQMYTYVASELPTVIRQHFNVSQSRQSIFGHSMGGHGALMCALRNPGTYQSVSAFAPIAYPTTSSWGQKAFTAYLGKDKGQWAQYDATLLAPKYSGPELPVLIDQGLEDEYYHKGELRVEDFFDAASSAKVLGAINLRKQPGYDHSYYFIATFMADHVAFHAKSLKTEKPE